jgi:Protein of unknown function (DUF3014)
MDDHDLEKDIDAPPPRPRFGGGDWLMVLVALAVVGGGGAWWWFHREPGPPPPAPMATPAPVEPTPAVAEPARPVTADRLRELLEAISVSTVFRGWLAQGDLIERWAVVTDNLSEGVSPRARLRFLAPKDGFTTARRGDRRVISAAAYARYDLIADAVGSVDVAAAVRAYRELHGPLEAAYRALGYPEGSLDRVTAAALKRVAAAPARDGDVFVEAGGTGAGTIYLYSAPELERLGPVEKQLLRMGPRNTRIIQAKARQLERALGFAPADAK